MIRSTWIFTAAIVAVAISSLPTFAGGRVVAELSYSQLVGSVAACGSFQTIQRIIIHADGEVRTSFGTSRVRCNDDGERSLHGHTSVPQTSWISEAELPGVLEKLRVARSSQHSRRGSGGTLSISLEGLQPVYDSSEGAWSTWDDLRGAIRSAERNGL